MASIDDNVGCKLLFRRRGNQALHLKCDWGGGPRISWAMVCFQRLFTCI